MKKLRMARTGYNVISAVFFEAAVVYLAFPAIPSFVVCWFSGITLLIYGAIKIIGYFSEDLLCLAFRYDLAFGLLLLALGVVVLMKQAAAMEHLAPGLGWATLLDGFFKIQMSEEAKKFGLKHWGNTFSGGGFYRPYAPALPHAGESGEAAADGSGVRGALH